VLPLLGFSEKSAARRKEIAAINKKVRARTIGRGINMKPPMY